MKWTEHSKPRHDVSHYDHVMCDTPIGKFMIEWKSWKERPSYSVMRGDVYVGEGSNLDEAKALAHQHLESIIFKLHLILDDE